MTSGPVTSLSPMHHCLVSVGLLPNMGLCSCTVNLFTAGLHVRQCFSMDIGHEMMSWPHQASAGACGPMCAHGQTLYVQVLTQMALRWAGRPKGMALFWMHTSGLSRPHPCQHDHHHDHRLPFQEAVARHGPPTSPHRRHAWRGVQTGLTRIAGQALGGFYVLHSATATHSNEASTPQMLSPASSVSAPAVIPSILVQRTTRLGSHPLSVLATSFHLTLGPGGKALAQRVSLPGPSAALCQEQNATTPDIPAWSPNVVLIWPSPVCLP